MKSFWEKGQTVLLQGDSVTDASRLSSGEEYLGLGQGYVKRIHDIYNTLYPQTPVNFVNRGVSGNRSSDLLERYQKDIKEVQPDFISILIGINDTWRRYDRDMEMTCEEYVSNYTQILEGIKKDLPNTKIMIMEPFLLPSDPEKDIFREDLDPKIVAARKLATQYADFYLPLDGILAGYACAKHTPIEMALDGIHPTELGHSILAYEYLKVLGMV